MRPMKKLKSITKALSVLELFLIKDEEMTLGNISKCIGLKLPTAYRVVSTLVAHGFLKQRKKRGNYSLGIRFLDFYGAKNRKAYKSNGAFSYLLEFSRLVNEAVIVNLWYGSNVLLSRSLDYADETISTLPPDWIVPLHSSCAGKITLAGLSQEDLNKYFQFRIKYLKNQANASEFFEKLKNEIDLTRKNGVALENDSRVSGARGIAAGIFNETREAVGSISVMGTTSRLSDAKMKQISSSLKICASKISEEIGYK